MPSTDVCVPTCTPAGPRHTALFSCCSRPAKPFHFLVDALGPPAMAALLPGASWPLAPDLRDPESSELGQSLAEVGFGGLPSVPSGAQMPRPSCLSLPNPTLCPPSLPKYLPWRCCPAIQTCPPWLPDPSEPPLSPEHFSFQKLVCETQMIYQQGVWSLRDLHLCITESLPICFLLCLQPHT